MLSTREPALQLKPKSTSVGFPPAHDDVLRLQVAVDEPARVQRRHRAARVGQDVDHLAERIAPLLPHVRPLDVFQDQHVFLVPPQEPQFISR